MFENYDLFKSLTIPKIVVEFLWGVAPGIFVFIFCYIFSTLSLKLLRDKILKISQKTSNKFDDLVSQVLQSINWLFLLFLSIAISLNFVNLSFEAVGYLNKFSIIVVSLYTTRVLQLTLNFLIDAYLKKDIKVVTPVKILADILLWVISMSIVLQNLGFNLSTLVAGLGIGGIAVAFAIQNILSDIFSSFSIYLDKPFEEGDLIVIGDDTGVVSKIGLKSTRLKTFHGEELIISNKELTTSRVRNFKKMEERRVTFTVGLDSNTSLSSIKKSKEILQEVILNQKNVSLDRINLKELGTDRAFFEVVYIVKNKDYYFYLTTQENIILEIMYEFKKHQISFSKDENSLVITKV